MKKLLSVLFLTAFIIGCADKSGTNKVKLSGKLINWGNASKILIDESLKSDFGLGNNVLIETNENDEFYISFELEEATYYSLGRNKLYLTPGDELELEIDYRDPDQSIFSGDHAAIQEYLCGVAFPKSGSYLSGGSFLKSPEIQQTFDLADSITAIRQELLLNLENPPDEFIDLEQTRLQLDKINTILSMPIYGSFKGYWEYTEDQKEQVLVSVKDELNEMSAGLMQDNHMKHPNFRGMLLDLVNPQLQSSGIFDHLLMTPFMKEYDEIGAFVSQIESEGLIKRIEAIADNYLQGDHSIEYKEMVKEKLDQYSVLKSGQSAMDIVFTNALGEEKALSEYKGELIYVDLWATWCGPCIDELPAFEKLKEDYKDQPISFVPISIDTDVERWQNYLVKNDLPRDKEYLINRLDLDDYKVITIPRYFLIDKAFNIIDVFATVPSDPETRKIINEYLRGSE